MAIRENKYPKSRKLAKAEDLINLATFKITRREFREALFFIDMTLQEFPDYMPAYILKGQIFLEQEQLEQGLEFLQHAEQLLKKMNMPDGFVLDESFLLRSYVSALYNNLGAALYRKKDFEKAIFYYEQALAYDIDPFNRGEIEKNIIDAKEQLILSTNFDKKTSSILWIQGSKFMKDGEYENALVRFTEAINIYHKLITKYPDVTFLRDNLSL
jgi:tetratricopeptide (TPR) repeat protein